MRFQLGCWDPEDNRPNGNERTVHTCRQCACVVEDELHLFVVCLADNRLGVKYGSDLGFHGCSMRPVVTEAPNWHWLASSQRCGRPDTLGSQAHRAPHPEFPNLS